MISKSLWVFAIAFAMPLHAQLQLKPCTLEAIAAKCGTLTVPEDHARPDGRKLALAVVAFPSNTSLLARDPLLILDGGPGSAATGLTSFVVHALAPVLSDRAVILMDQRGTGRSNQLTCDLAPQHFLVPKDTASCLAELRSHADLSKYGTLDFVEDIEALRRALGADHVHLYGASYGSRVAQLYLREHPDVVLSIVMAGPAPMSMIIPDGVLQDSETALEQIVKDCAAHKDCAAAFPGLKIPPPGFDGFSRIGLHLLMYSPETARRVPWLLAQAAAGHSQIVHREIEEARTMLAGSIALGSHLAVICNEDLPLAKASTGPFAEEYRQACRGWPVSKTPAGLHDPVKSTVPLLMLIGEHDPITGAVRAKELQQYFSGARIIVVPGGGHMFGGFSGCLDRGIAAFLKGLSPDASCLAKLPPASYFLGQ
jgi:pimeloyl-ACP methyl ester carboxylesterase